MWHCAESWPNQNFGCAARRPGCSRDAGLQQTPSAPMIPLQQCSAPCPALTASSVNPTLEASQISMLSEQMYTLNTSNVNSTDKTDESSEKLLSKPQGQHSFRKSKIEYDWELISDGQKKRWRRRKKKRPVRKLHHIRPKLPESSDPPVSPEPAQKAPGLVSAFVPQLVPTSQPQAILPTPMYSLLSYPVPAVPALSPPMVSMMQPALTMPTMPTMSTLPMLLPRLPAPTLGPTNQVFSTLGSPMNNTISMSKAAAADSLSPPVLSTCSDSSVTPTTSDCLASCSAPSSPSPSPSPEVITIMPEENSEDKNYCLIQTCTPDGDEEVKPIEIFPKPEEELVKMERTHCDKPNTATDSNLSYIGNLFKSHDIPRNVAPCSVNRNLSPSNKSYRIFQYPPVGANDNEGEPCGANHRQDEDGNVHQNKPTKATTLSPCKTQSHQALTHSELAVNQTRDGCLQNRTSVVNSRDSSSAREPDLLRKLPLSMESSSKRKSGLLANHPLSVEPVDSSCNRSPGHFPSHPLIIDPPSSSGKRKPDHPSKHPLIMNPPSSPNKRKPSHSPKSSLTIDAVNPSSNRNPDHSCSHPLIINQLNSSCKRKPDHPSKHSLTMDPADSSSKSIHGHPPKHSLIKDASNSSCKRKRGRPRKQPLIIIPQDLLGTLHKRKPGRPRKYSSIDKPPDSANEIKRRPGRPRKHEKVGRPGKHGLEARGIPVFNCDTSIIKSEASGNPDLELLTLHDDTLTLDDPCVNTGGGSGGHAEDNYCPPRRSPTRRLAVKLDRYVNISTLDKPCVNRDRVSDRHTEEDCCAERNQWPLKSELGNISRRLVIKLKRLDLSKYQQNENGSFIIKQNSQGTSNTAHQERETCRNSSRSVFEYIDQIKSEIFWCEVTS